MSQENKVIIEKVNKAFAEGRTEDVLEHWDEDVVWVMEGEVTTEGKSAVREFMATSGESAPPKFTVDKTVAEGDSVICYGLMRMEAPPECSGSYSYCDAYTLKDGKVIELRSFVVKHKAEAGNNGTAAG